MIGCWTRVNVFAPIIPAADSAVIGCALVNILVSVYHSSYLERGTLALYRITHAQYPYSRPLGSDILGVEFRTLEFSQWKGSTNYSTMLSGAGITDIFISLSPVWNKHLKCLEIFWMGVVLPAASGRNLTLCTRQPPPQRIIQFGMSIVQRLRNHALREAKLWLFHSLEFFISF